MPQLPWTSRTAPGHARALRRPWWVVAALIAAGLVVVAGTAVLGFLAGPALFERFGADPATAPTDPERAPGPS